ncbi:MAG: amidohydrolase family protein [Rickettsiales bacterium]|nr:amidohydrolase family protein [Pseudomonadota bacterium]MDA0966246.1 amidohydrolase family protein [Pseudomonadota bacterium]MDG4543089.1 amidohydrolase family protein [Rickettsiales bacterium]MDG4545287.1 amidohydrolase family protein [Rickettsiales bacterium]MDG4547736.1 amidohydrolase family protein [Rickettsiales bacterium]
MNWIDTHVHLFAQNDNNDGIPTLQPQNSLNTPEIYFNELKGNSPESVVVVDFSMSKNSQHVISALDELKKNGKKAAGVIKGDLNNENTLKWIKRDDVKGIRLYAKDSTPDISSEQWQSFLKIIEAEGKHVLIFGTCGYIVELIKQIPKGITILIDHLGLPKLGEDDINFRRLLEISKLRNNIYFKGPGYRTSIDADKVKPIIRQIVESVGHDKLILGASDAPFAGPVLESTPEYAGKKYCEFMNYNNVLSFIKEISEYACTNDSEKQKVLYGNAKEIYGF